MQKWQPGETASEADWGLASQREPLIRLLAQQERLTRECTQQATIQLGRRSGNSQSRCRTFWASDFPFAFSQCSFNHFSLLILESALDSKIKQLKIKKHKFYL
jgi:hypothetical protein